MLRRSSLSLFASLAVLFGCADTPTSTEPAGALSAELSNAKGGRAGSLGVVYVRSQGLYYDTFVSAESLPPRGRFQKLENGATDYGPGDPGYLGGRWWVDENGNGIQDADDSYLLCPLLPPGRTSP
jgi:hypothetical protein